MPNDTQTTVTPEMIEAGRNATRGRLPPDELMTRIYLAMRALEPPHPGYRLPEEWEPQ